MKGVIERINVTDRSGAAAVKLPNNKKRKKLRTLEDQKAVAGRLFILPWLIGAVFLFLLPFVQSALYTFSKITVGDEGVKLVFYKFSDFFHNYNYLFTQNPDFIPKLTASIESMLWQTPIIVFFSLFVAMLLKSKFHGRTFARAVFFFPVIIASGVVISILRENASMATNVAGNFSNQQAGYLFQAPSFATTLIALDIPEALLAPLINLTNEMFDLAWKSGVQILLLLAAVNNIPSSSYEAADIEGATEWEKFWKITFPLVSPTLLVTVMYTIIDAFTDYGNKVMLMVNDFKSKNQYEMSTTVAFSYFLCILVIIGLVNAIISRHVFYMSE